MHWNRPKIALKLLWNCSGIALELLWNCSETALKPLQSYPENSPVGWIGCNFNAKGKYLVSGPRPLWIRFGSALEPPWNRFGREAGRKRNWHQEPNDTVKANWTITPAIRANHADAKKESENSSKMFFFFHFGFLISLTDWITRPLYSISDS